MKQISYVPQIVCLQNEDHELIYVAIKIVDNAIFTGNRRELENLVQGMQKSINFGLCFMFPEYIFLWYNHIPRHPLKY